MASNSMLLSRALAEIGMLSKSPPPGISCWPVGDSMVEFEAVIVGAEETPYEQGEFKVSIQLPQKYPMEPPRCLFKTKIYHPNIDEGGRICLDILNLPPKGAWKPSLNLSTVLMSLRLLLSSPNPDDPLVAHISEQFIADYSSFSKHAKAYTQQYAMSHMTSSSPLASADPIEVPKPSNINPESSTPTAPRLALGLSKVSSLPSHEDLQSNPSKKRSAPPIEYQELALTEPADFATSSPKKPKLAEDPAPEASHSSSTPPITSEKPPAKRLGLSLGLAKR